MCCCPQLAATVAGAISSRCRAHTPPLCDAPPQSYKACVARTLMLDPTPLQQQVYQILETAHSVRPLHALRCAAVMHACVNIRMCEYPRRSAHSARSCGACVWVTPRRNCGRAWRLATGSVTP